MRIWGGAEKYLVYEQYHAINDDYENNNRYYITKEKYKELKAFDVKPGDLIISCTGTIGKISEIPFNNFKKGIINTALLKLSLDNNKILNKYFIYYFRSNFIQNEIKRISTGSTVPQLSSCKKIGLLNFLVPSLEKQKLIISEIENIEKMKKIAQKDINDLHKIYNSKMYKYFNI